MIEIWDRLVNSLRYICL
ncbi:TPA: hypothetical protein ACHOZK_001765 [Raoultella ornithinolytica]